MGSDRMIVAGFGFRAAARPASLRAAFDLARGDRPHVDALAVPQDKAAAFASLAAALDRPVIAVPAEDLAAAQTLTQSTASQAARGTGSVAEAAALAGAGAGARLLGPRHVSPDRLATCALAEGRRP